MQQKLANLSEIMSTLRGFLPQYLEEHGIDITKNFSCLNPAHVDSNPSMTIAHNPENAYCFTCHSTADIFQAVHWLENKPIDGPLFITQNVMFLAEKFGIEVELEEMTEDELYRFNTYRAYQNAAQLIADTNFGDYTKVDKELERRKWKKDKIKDSGIGTVEYNSFRNMLKKVYGYSASFLNEIDLSRADIFNTDNLIFTIKDEWGRPVGFIGRNLDYHKGSGEAKYKNQKTTGLKCNIYQKAKRLYGIHIARKHTPPLYIFEGYADVITAQQAGLKNAVAIAGTAFTDEHIQLLKKLDINDVVLALDGDRAGALGTKKILDEKLAGEKDLHVSVINIPDDMDPDEYINKNGLSKFMALKKWSAFEWRLNLYTDEDDPYEICGKMIPIIVNESSAIKQEKMCADLALFTGVDIEAIRRELEILQNIVVRQKNKEREKIFSQAMVDVKKNPDNAHSLLLEYAARIEKLEDVYNQNAYSQHGMIEFIQHQKQLQELEKSGNTGFELSDLGLGGLADILNSGVWREDVFLCLGGQANVGKSAMCCQLAYEIAANQNNNACVIMHTIDDSAAQLLPRFVVQAYGHIDLTINDVRNPQRAFNITNDKTIFEKREIGYSQFLGLAKEGRIILKDASDGSSFEFGEALIKYYQKKFPDRQIVYILDNLHKTPDYETFDPRMRFKTLSNHMKNVATKYHIPIISTVEYTKLPQGIIPDNNNIAETRAIIYDASFIGHLYSDLDWKGEDSAILVHEEKGSLLPRIRLGVGKNKITSYKGRLFFDFYPASGILKWVNNETAKADMIERQRLLKKTGE